MLQVQHNITVAALAERFGVSAMTIRRDLDALEERNLLRREHGRAVYSAPFTDVQRYENRLMQNAAGKKRIAQNALKYLHGVQSVYLDGSTTCTTFLESFPPGTSLPVYTNSVPALNILVGRPGMKAFIFGGMLSDSMLCLDSTHSLSRCNDIFVDAAFISCTGYDASRIINHDVLTVNERRIMLKNASRRYLLADSGKRDRPGVFTICGWDAIDVFITDAAPDALLAEALRENGVKVTYRPRPGTAGAGPRRFRSRTARRPNRRPACSWRRTRCRTPRTKKRPHPPTAWSESPR